MRLRGSRYENVKPFAPGDDGSVAFQGLRARAIGAALGTIERHCRRRPARPDLAQYFNDDHLWWQILDANAGFCAAASCCPATSMAASWSVRGREAEP